MTLLIFLDDEPLLGIKTGCECPFDVNGVVDIDVGIHRRDPLERWKGFEGFEDGFVLDPLFALFQLDHCPVETASARGEIDGLKIWNFLIYRNKDLGLRREADRIPYFLPGEERVKMGFF